MLQAWYLDTHAQSKINCNFEFLFELFLTLDIALSCLDPCINDVIKEMALKYTNLTHWHILT